MGDRLGTPGAVGIFFIFFLGSFAFFRHSEPFLGFGSSKLSFNFKFKANSPRAKLHSSDSELWQLLPLPHFWSVMPERASTG